MQYTMQIFEYEDHDQFRVIDHNGEPWFVLAEVCKKLGIVNTGDAASSLDEDERMTIGITDSQKGTRGGARQMTIINESGLYSLVLRSRKPEAKRFKKWITSEVLPSIRKTGSYGGHVPAFIKRYNENWNRVSGGHFFSDQRAGCKVVGTP
ncbi:Bro-N domain-containing protein (plasmid) [Pseudosulfitobacter pseudonitzschiae]|uniref:BRO-N domain-containing protein n=1 Tax=Pseudosulfitobacter pseudonitzschiae TaxID=1402135 RepID=UPI001E45A9D9|nr:Bro-N domain-containing protein [Pseudosulfitobacter pseudonitzschiae]UFE50050.1 Bro-N domain-containing protein [Pseudosulfitobacter pseudonitzschiae]